ncbi:MAG: BPSS1780 family membrane protein [Gammaproteobacteria bacterium]
MDKKKPGFADVLAWYRSGWGLFRKDPITWALFTVMWAVLVLALFQVPLLGAVMAWAMTPAIYAGYLYAAQDLSAGRTIGTEQLLRGLKQRDTRMRLLTVGAITLLIYLLGAVVLFTGPSTPAGTSVTTEAAAHGMGLALIINYALRILLMSMASVLGVIAFIYACPAIIFTGAEPIEAVVTSIETCYTYWRATLSFMLVFTALAIPALATVGLGLLVLMPVSCCAAYAAYRSIFG